MSGDGDRVPGEPTGGAVDHDAAQAIDADRPHRHGDFTGQVGVVTGGSQGLGYAVAELQKARGAEALVLVGRDPAKGEAAAAALDGDGCAVSFVSADLATTEGAEAVAAAVDERHGRVDTLAHCAAATWRGTVWNTTGDMWDEMLGTNVKASGLLVSGMARIMAREETPGSMALVGSIAHHGSIGELFPYVVAKHALVALVSHAAYSLRMERIRVNLINPGWMDTPAEDAIQKRFHDADDDWLAQAEARMPFGRLLKPTEVARTICFALSGESGMMSGASIDVDQTMPGQGPGAPFEPVPRIFPWEQA
ncbi:MAG: oxidoreductase [Actinomycetota bacterium]